MTSTQHCRIKTIVHGSLVTVYFDVLGAAIATSDTTDTNPTGVTISSGQGSVAHIHNLAATNVTAAVSSLSVTSGLTHHASSAYTILPAGADNAESSISTSHASRVAGNEVTITVTLKDQFQNPIPSVTPVLAATPSTGVGTISCGATNASGVATCTFTPTIIGNRTIGITSPANISKTVDVLVTHASALKLSFTNANSLSAEVAGVDFSVQPALRIEDQYGNLVSTGADATASVSVQAYDDASCLTASTSNKLREDTSASTSVSESASGGLLSYTQLNFIKRQTIYFKISTTLNSVARSSCSGVNTDNSDGTAFAYTVEAAPAAKVVFSAPTSQTSPEAGVNFSPQPAIQILDVFDNLVESDDAVAATGVTLTAFTNDTCTIAGGGNIRTSTSNGVNQNASNGVLTFANVNYTKNETIYIKATTAVSSFTACSGQVGGAPSGTFSYAVAPNSTVDPGTSTFTLSSNSPTAGDSITATVTAKDIFSNTIPSRAVTMSYSPSTAESGTLPASCGTTNGSGVTTCSIIPQLATTRVITATVANTPSNVALTQTQSMVVAPNSSARIVFTAPSSNQSHEASVNFSTQPAVQIQDTYGNAIASGDGNYNGTVTLTAYNTSNCSGVARTFLSLDNGSNLISSTSGAASGASKTFANLSYTKAETMYFKAEVGALSVCSGQVASGSQQFSYVISNNSTVVAGTSSMTLSTATPTAGVAMDITVRARDAFSNPVAGRAVTLAYSGGAAQNGETLTTACGNTDAAGDVTCSFTPKYAIARNITPTIANSSNVTLAAQGITTSPAAANQLAFSVQPATTSVAAGTALTTQPVVVIKDAYGNNTGAGTDSVTLRVYSSAGCNGYGASDAVGYVNVGGNSREAVESASAGTATFSGVTYTNPSSESAETLRFGAMATGLTSVCSSSVANSLVTHSTATKLAYVVQPGGAAAGANLSPQPEVEVQDVYGNRVMNSSVQVDIAIQSGSGVLSGTTGVNASTGLVTYAGLKVTGASSVGDKVLRVTSGALTLADSGTVTITPSSLGEFTIVNTTEGTTAGTNSVFTVTAKDSEGNVKTDYAGTMTVTTNDVFPHEMVTPADGTLEFNGTQSGVGAITLKFKTAGSRTMTVTDGGVNKTSTGFTVVAASASQIAVNAGNSQSKTAAQALDTNPSVIVKDTYNNPVAAGVSVLWTVSSGGGSVNVGAGQVGSGSSSTNASGIAALTNWTLGSATGSNGLEASINTGAQTINFTATATPEALDDFIVSANASSTAGATLNVTVTARDTLGNTKTDFTGNVTLTSSDGNIEFVDPATGIHNFVSGDAGVKVYQVKLKSAGVQSVTATGGGETGTTNVTVNAASASQIAVHAGNSQSAVAGANVATAPAVIVKDTYNNPVSGVGITWGVTAGGGSVTVGGGSSTNGSGIATVTSWTLGTTAGANSLGAEFTSNSGINTSFSATGNAGAATKIVWVSASPAERYEDQTFTASARLQDVNSNNVSTASVAVDLIAYDTAACTGSPVAFSTGTSPENTNASGIASFSGLSLAAAQTVYVRAESGVLTPSACQTLVVYPELTLGANFTTIKGGANSTITITGGKSPFTVSLGTTVSGTPGVSPSGSTASTTLTFTSGTDTVAGCGNDRVLVSDALGQNAFIDINVQQIDLKFTPATLYDYNAEIPAASITTDVDTSAMIVENDACGLTGTLGNATLSGANAGQFSVQTDGCTGETLNGALNETCSIVVRFLGASAGAGTYESTINTSVSSGTGAGSTSASRDLEATR